MQRIILPATVLAVLGLSGCSSGQAYSAGQAWQRNECERRLDPQERAQCLERANVPYDTYRQQSDAATKGR